VSAIDEILDRIQYLARAAVHAATAGDAITAEKWLAEIERCVRELRSRGATFPEGRSHP
jgi:hypothetical protein